MRKEIKEILKEFGETVFPYRRQYNKMAEEMLPDEVLRYFRYTTIEIEEKKSEEHFKASGTLFISDRRVLFRDGGIRIIKEIPIRDIHAISTRNKNWISGMVSFSTRTQIIKFETFSDKTLLEKVAGVLEDVIREAKEFHSQQTGTELYSQGMEREYVIVNCLGCGAFQVLLENTTEECDYCNRMLSAKRAKEESESFLEESSQRKAEGVQDVEEEIKKLEELVEMGILTQEELTHKKEILRQQS